MSGPVEQRRDVVKRRGGEGRWGRSLQLRSPTSRASVCGLAVSDLTCDSSVTTPEDAAHLIHGYLVERRPALAIKQLAALLG